jgi:hypothetical protein
MFCLLCLLLAGITMQLLACRPKSKGSVGLTSTNPFDPAKVCVCVCVL